MRLRTVGFGAVAGMVAWLGLAAGALAAAAGGPAAPASLAVAGDWEVRVEAGGVATTVRVDGPDQVKVVDEKIDRLPVFNPKGAEYARGRQLAGVFAQECSVRHALVPESLVVRLAPGGAALERGKDYDAELSWGCVGRLEGGAIGAETPVFASYTYGRMRLDSVVRAADGRVVLRKGAPHVSAPVAPELAAGEKRLGSIWVTGRLEKLGDANLFPILEEAYPEPAKASPTVAERLIPRTMAKLSAGGKVTILAWGDSVTEASYLPRKADQWQEQFVARLRARYPGAQITLITEAWGGRNTDSYRNEPPGSIHNYKEKVLGRRPDLVISEFVNDAWFDEGAVFQKYGRIRDEFREIGAEWIILTPHYVRTDWMGLTRETDIDDDPRPYVKALRKFAAANDIALADASLRYGRLWRQGIPYSTLMMNNINHPNPFGMRLFADALMGLFP